MEERIYLSQPQVTGKEMGYIERAFATNHITLFGRNIDEFEQGMANYSGCKYALALNSGTAGLHLATRYAGVGPGDLVICSSLTFAASCNPVLYQGGTPVFVDSDEETWNMCPDALEKAIKYAKSIGKIPKAAVIADLYGQAAKYDVIVPMLNEYDITVIEDAAEALGSTYEGKKCGTLGDFGIYSFDSNKLITASCGGIVVSNDKVAIDKMRYWSAQAREALPYYEHKEYGYQYRMSNILAGIGCAQVPVIDTYVNQRREINRVYEKELKDLPINMMHQYDKGRSNCWLSVMTLQDKSLVLKLIEHLEESNIETRMVWKPMHLQPIYQSYQYFTKDEGVDVSRKLFEHGICLPSASVMTDEQQMFVIEKIKNFFGK